MWRCRAATLACGLSVLAACEPPAEPLSGDPAEVVFGADDRREVYAADPALAELARRSVVTLMWNTTVGGGLPARVVPGPTTLRQAYGLCPDEPFVDEPVLGVCTGTLVDDDLVLTAAHCVATADSCRLGMFVFDYLYDAPGMLASMDAEDIYGCRAVVAYRYDPEGSPTRRDDYAIVALDRPVPSTRVPVAVASEARIAPGTAVVSIGSGLSLPLKVDAGGRVNAPERALHDWFLATIDAFEGSSGAGVFDGSLHVVGIVARGEGPSFAPRAPGLCASLTHSSGETGGEQVSFAANAVRTLCESGYPSRRLCAREPRCGDGFCTVGEDASACAVDCGASRCGDRRCDPSEVGRCGADCGYPSRCGDGTCDADEPGACVADCPPVACGNGLCEAPSGETPSACPSDCPRNVCRNGLCEGTWGEDPSSCPADCRTDGGIALDGGASDAGIPDGGALDAATPITDAGDVDASDAGGERHRGGRCEADAHARSSPTAWLVLAACLVLARRRARRAAP